MLINILHDTDFKPCFKKPETMNVYLMLYAKSVGEELIDSWNGASITLSTGQTVASKQYIAKVFNRQSERVSENAHAKWFDSA